MTIKKRLLEAEELKIVAGGSEGHGGSGGSEGDPPQPPHGEG